MNFNPIAQLLIGIKAPIQSVKFFKKYKSLFILGAIPHFIVFVIYAWCVQTFAITKGLNTLITTLRETGHIVIAGYMESTFVNVFIWSIAVLFYGVIGIAIVNTLASPIYDILAAKAYTEYSKKKTPDFTFIDFLTGIVSEATKALIVFAVIFISFFITPFAPLFFILSIWYFGWNTADRTLLLLNMNLKDRLMFGVKHFFICIGLGLWNYIPFFSILYSFGLAVAGAHTIAEAEKLDQMEIK